MHDRVPSFRWRAIWGVADQVFSSLTNMGLSVVAARALSVREFAAFTFVYVAYLLVLGASRSVTSEPLLVHYSTATRGTFRQGVSRSSGTSAGVGLAAGLSCITLGVAIGGSAMSALAVLGACLPALLVQDLCRFAFFAEGRPLQALANDALWAALLCVVLIVGARENWHSPASIMAAWAGTGAVAGLVGCCQIGTRPHLRQAVGWLRAEWGLASRFFGEWGVLNGVSQTSIYAVAAVADVTAVAALRGARVLLGPWNVLSLGIRPVAIAEGVRILERSRSRFVLFLVAVSTTLALGLVLTGSAALLLPDRVGVMILGKTWIEARPVILPAALLVAGECMALGAIVGLRSMAAADASLRTRAIVGVGSLTTTLVGAALDGAVGAAAGGAIATWSGAALWWWVMLKTFAATGSPRKSPVVPGEAASARSLAEVRSS